MIGAIDFLATQQGEQHFSITDIKDITGKNIAVKNDEICKFSKAQGARRQVSLVNERWAKLLPW
jgi:hypothetical protein